MTTPHPEDPAIPAGARKAAARALEKFHIEQCSAAGVPQYLTAEAMLPTADAALAAAMPLCIAAERELLALVAEFCGERGQYITGINNCPPGNDDDYYRWQGHAEARRQLTERLEGARAAALRSSVAAQTSTEEGR